MRVAASAAAAVALGGSAAAQGPSASSRTNRDARGSAPYNILFVLTDQERFFRPGELPQGYSLPAHERLMKRGTTFVNHRINSCVCKPSRSVLYTGQHIQHTRMFDNTNFPWIASLSPEIRTIGDMLRDAGYYTAYKGKWHLTKEFETVNKLDAPTRIFTKEMESYGFADYFGVGDIIAHVQGGYLHDGVIAAMGASWLRGRGRELAAQRKPWFLAVNLVNPHDVMFYDTDAPGTPFKPDRGLAHVARDPVDPLYAKQWTFKLPASHAQPLDAAGRPSAHRDFLRSHDAMVGAIPNEEARWRRRHNYYLNCLRDVDRSLASLLAELDAAGLAERTIVRVPGKDFSALLAAPERAAVDAVRDGALFNYNMFAYLDGDFLHKAVEHLNKGGKPNELKQAGIGPDMAKRGAVRSVYDGRYVFARYFSPRRHNRPASVEELYKRNDVELYDVQADPSETNNLAMGDRPRREIVLAMNDKLNRLIDAEVGEDRGQMLPGGIEAGWEVTPQTMAP